ncbi:MAG TPA: UDP-N-acetylmuramate--L-alanine ligase, partial [Armatimonadota bacterium]|nr:UDP-N-acetylmuramate--L-alanine ligase [Armatimonadota bacterium]
ARAWGRRTIAIFQPHLYSRTEFFANDFAKALSAADQVIVTDIYAAREQPMPGVSGKMIADRIPHAQFIPDKEKIADELIPNLQSGDLVVVMGAGDIRATAEEILERLTSNE